MLEKYKEKKIGILGFETEGRATLEFLNEHGLQAGILDQISQEKFEELNPGISVKEIFLGENYLNHLKDFDVIFKTPGISPNKPEIKEAISFGVEFTSQIELFFDLCPCKIIGVTGTKGKGTTSTLIYQMLKNAGKDAYLGGNIGVPAVSFLDKLTESSIVVLELSSFQLQVLKKSPHIAVVLNITSEHLDYHKDTEEYRNAKKNIVLFQTKDDFAVINDDYDVPKSFASATSATKYFVSRDHKTNGCYVDENDNVILANNNDILINFSELQLRGRHNLENVTAASMAATLAGVAPKFISQTLKEFRGLEHRLEFVREIDGVKYFNDSFSTVPETAIAAIDAFSEPKIIIMGGSDKGSNYEALGKKIANSNIKALILIGEMAEKIDKAIPAGFTGQKIFGLRQMKEMVEKAKELANAGDVVLLSPACASFGIFKNYKDRGNQFKEAVRQL